LSCARVWVALASLFLSCDALAAATSAFDAGVRAYRSGDFAGALHQFDLAREAGDHSDQLLFNRGLALYRLKRYSEARDVFLELRARPDLTEFAEYHLGLIAATLGDPAAAERHLDVVAASQVPELRQLAETALSRLERPSRARSWGAYARLGPGFDTNRNQIAESLQIEGPEPESAYGELYGVLYGRVPGLGGATFQAGAFVRNYEVDDALDQSVVQLMLRKSWRTPHWSLAFAGEIESAVLDGSALTDVYSLSFDAARPFKNSTLRVRYRPSVIAAGSAYDYLEGRRHQLELADELSFGPVRLQLGYEAELNDRRDLEIGTEFYSQSPARHGPVIRLNRALGSRLQIDLSTAYRSSRFRDENRQFVDGVLETERRVDALWVAGIVLRLELSPSWGLRLDYRHSENRSTVDRYDYDRDLAAVALEWRH
jgi:tetratricopeptide (TPR) repeat protein